MYGEMAKIRKVDGKRFLLDIDKFIENPDNPNEHPQGQIDDLKNEIQRLGFRGEIVIDEENTIICGHGRVQACKELGIKKLPVVQYDDLTEAEKISYMQMDNRIGQYSNQNIEKLQENFIKIEELGGIISEVEKDLFNFAIPDIDIKTPEFDSDITIEQDPNVVASNTPVTDFEEKKGEELNETYSKTGDSDELGEGKEVIKGIQIPVRGEIYEETFEIYRDLLKKGVDIGDIFLKALKDYSTGDIGE